MCGIITIVHDAERKTSLALLDRLTTTLAHRGPDDSGYAQVEPSFGRIRTWTRESMPAGELGGILFGHRRLSILDLSDAGHQPWVDHETGTVLAYNGEVFNFLELRAELESLGVVFRSRSDTEVLARAYERWGADAFERLNGMWAFTLWDARRKALIACRDRFGIKPLYYCRAGGRLVFASEIKALLEVPEVARTANPQRVLGFLTRGIADQGVETFFSEVRSVAPGTYLEVRAEGAVAERRFYRLRIDPEVQHAPRETLAHRTRSLLADAVALRTRSDVPIGTMLSGGLDSTSITVLIDECKRGLAPAGSPPAFDGLRLFHQAFSAVWPNSAQDEERPIALLCDRLGLTSHRIRVTGEAATSVLDKVVYHLDEPFETPIPIVQYILMREAGAAGVRVVLNGHGSDETLAGYPRKVVPARLADLLLTSRLGSFATEYRASRRAGAWRRSDILVEMFRRFGPRRARLAAERVLRRRRLTTDGLFAQTDTDPDVPLFDDSIDWAGTSPSRLQAQLWTHVVQQSLPMWLRLEDRMSMAASVEARVPFMDYRMVELAMSLPDDVKVRHGYTKWILRAAMADALPAPIAWNPRKLRFAAPFDGWIRGPWREMLGDLFLTGASHVEPYLQMGEFRRRLQGYLDGGDRPMKSVAIWRILNTELWFRALGRREKPGRVNDFETTGVSNLR